MALADNLVAYLNLDESNDGDDAVVDYHKNVNANDMRDRYSNVGAEPTGQPNNAGRRYLAGAGAHSEYFDCINDQGDYYHTSTGPFSFSMWFTVVEFAQHRHLLTRWDNLSATEQEWRIAVSSASRKPFIGVRKDASTVAYLTASDATVYSGVLYFMSGGYDPDSDVLWLSMNGESKYTSAGPGGHFYVNQTNFFTIGSVYADHDNQTTQNGRIARVGFWEKVLNDAENLQLYNSGAGLKYPFSTPSIATDEIDGSLLPGGGSKIYLPPFHPLV